MRFLCLPGALCNVKTLESQLGPFLSALQKEDHSISFVYTQGLNPVVISPEFEGFFGPPPNFTFTDSDIDGSYMPVRTMGREGNPEDAIRKFSCTTSLWKDQKPSRALAHLLDLIDQDPEIDGILGFSEGAGIAASLIIEENKRQEASGRVPRLKCALFFSGVPPSEADTGRFLLHDEDGTLIHIPTLHVLGSQDPMIHTTMALYNVCDSDAADLFDHGGGHIIPRDAQTVSELADMVHTMIADLQQY
ncbi:Uncharacterized protein PECH_001433 [Penicillium ucsense]|uniref:Serine hydrolase domain-containing protein n=1 Tax=Penicillium ucsense TaxID=2839758 RepID=A0A8J8W0V6_9EURO|nr:Uncharacterized protein PECM_007108 [Penicillium ucsense]KAF7738205.1 Uncharacterized protein PECH_001433 [Penicillium ucsense]